MSAERASLVDVFENALGHVIEHLPDNVIASLSPEQADELLGHLDEHLAASAHDAFAADAVMLDGFASPIVMPYDRTERRTTRRAKQVALAHSEVVLSVQELALDYGRYGRDHIASLFEWTRRYRKLLQSHVLSVVRTPDVLDTLEPDQIADLAEWVADRFPEVGSDAATVDPSALRSMAYAMIQDTFAAGTLGTVLSFTHEPEGRIYEFCARSAEAAPITSSPLSHASLLRDLELPSLDDLADDDFVSIRLESEDFGAFRAVLGRALRETAREVQLGGEVTASFRHHLDEIRWQAELLRRDTRDKTLKRYFRPAIQNVALGSLVSTTAASAATAAEGSEPSLLAAGVRFGTSVVLGTLISLLLYNPPNRKERLLRFYDVLLEERNV